MVEPDIKSLQDSLLKAKERLDFQEVKGVMDDLLEQVTQA